MGVTATFCTCSDPRNVVDKTFATVVSKSCTIVYPCDVLRPTLKVLGGVIDANAVTGIFGRNYWITGQTLDNGINYVSLVVDALSSWKSSILNTNQYVARSETDYNLMIPDNLLPVAVDNIPQVKQSTNKIGGKTEMFIVGISKYDHKPDNFTPATEDNTNPSWVTPPVV